MVQKDSVIVALAASAYLQQAQIVFEYGLMHDISCFSDVDDVRWLFGDFKKRIEFVYFAVSYEHASEVLDRWMDVRPKIFQIADLLIVLNNIQTVPLVGHD